MMWNGCWLAGTVGGERVAKLTRDLNSKILSKINDTTGRSFGEYNPWMSSSRVHQSFLNADSDLSCFRYSPDLIVDNRTLRFLHQSFANSKKGPLANLGYIGNDERVCEPDAEYLHILATHFLKARTMVLRASDSFHSRINSLIHHVIPLQCVNSAYPYGRNGAGLSLHTYRGGIFLGLPSDFPERTAELAINLVHELGHQAVMTYQYADPILVSGHDTPVYSAIKKESRPAIMSFHALAALAYMCEFTRSFKSADRDEQFGTYFVKRYHEIRSDFDKGWNAMSRLQFTELGKGMMAEFRSLIDA